MTDYQLATTLADLDFLAQHWPDLTAARIPGTARPWRQLLMSRDQRAERAARDRAERSEQDDHAPGFTPAPLHVDVLDLLVHGSMTVRYLATRAVRRLPWPGPPLEVRDLTVEQTICWLLDCLPTAVAVDPSVLDGNGLQSIARELSAMLRLLRGGQALSGAVCPWCRGVTPDHPAGGATTMRVEEVEAPRPASSDGRPATEGAYAVVCWNPGCEPPAADYGTEYRGRPAWPTHEWSWLADRLIAAEVEQHAATTTTETPSTAPRIRPVHHSGRSGMALQNREGA